MFEVILSPEARDFFAAADKPLARKLARCFNKLEQEPRRHNNVNACRATWQAYFDIESVTGACCIGSMKRQPACSS